MKKRPHLPRAVNNNKTVCPRLRDIVGNVIACCTPAIGRALLRYVGGRFFEVGSALLR